MLTYARLEQVRLDLRKLRSEPSLVLPRAHSILQGKMLHFAASSVPCLAVLLVSQAGNTGMLAYARVCSRTLTYAHVCSRMLTYD